MSTGNENWRCFLMLPLAIGLGLATSAGAEQNPNGTIRLPEQPTKVELFAAKELQKGLGEAMGWKMAIEPGTAKSTDKPVFWVGTLDRKRLESSGFPVGKIGDKAESLQEDGIRLYGDGSDVLLLGKGRRGPLNAVYTFLQDVVGFRWPEPGQEYVPKPATVSLKGIDVTHGPTFRYRAIGLHGTTSPELFGQIIDWMAKNKIFMFTQFTEPYKTVRPANLEGILNRGLVPDVGAHDRIRFYSADAHFDKHPEHFAELEGKRVKHTHLCYSDHGSIPEYAKNVVAFLKDYPEIEIIDIWPSDGFGFCECAKCKAAPLTDTILDYSNELCKAINAKLPNMKCELPAYISFTVPPKAVKPVPNLVIVYAEYVYRSQFRPITEDLAQNKLHREQLRQWIADTQDILVCSYYADDCIKRFLYQPLMDMVVTEMRHYKKEGLSGNTVLFTNPASWWSHSPHVYAYARASWDADEDLAKIEGDYYQSLYGPAASAMMRHAKACRALFDLKTSQGNKVEEVIFGMGFAGFDPSKDAQTRKQVEQTVSAMKDALKEARAANPSPHALETIAKLESDAEYVRLVFATEYQEQMALVEKTKESKAKAIDLIEQAMKLDVMATDDARGYNTGNQVLRTVAGRVLGITSWVSGFYKDVKSLEEFARDGIGHWDPPAVSSSDKDHPKTIKFEVTDKIKSAGSYQVVWAYLSGPCALGVLKTSLYASESADGKFDSSKPIAVDEHLGWTGVENRNNTFTLKFADYDPKKHYFLVGSVYSDGGRDSYGRVLFRAAP